MTQLKSGHWIAMLYFGVSLLSNAVTAAAEPFRPETGKFPPFEQAHSYRGELVFVDHANRRGSIRIQAEGKFRFISPSPFAMLPYPYLFRHSWKTTL
jgi:hypothetical protein